MTYDGFLRMVDTVTTVFYVVLLVSDIQKSRVFKRKRKKVRL